MAHSLGNIAESLAPMLEKAIQNAKFHGINLHPGVRNLANGDCAFETVIDSISTRPCFDEVYQGTPEYWRRVWVSEVEQVGYKDWNGGKDKTEM